VALTSDEILAIPALYSQIRVQSRAMIDMFESDTRMSAPFATQQRWLMSHVGLEIYFHSVTGGRSPGINISHFIDVVHKHGIASRNTADSFIKELIKYKYVIQTADPQDKRLRPLIPVDSVIRAIAGWLLVHLASLDGLAGGNRVETLHNAPGLLAYIQPAVAQGLITNRAVRSPEATFSLFTWLDNGGLVMDWLIASMPDLPPDTERVSVGRLSVAEMAAKLSLSRTHLARKLKEAEDLGSIGWEGRRGHSVMWVSKGFRQEYANAQAAKLSIIDHAFEAATARTAA
jgi:AraC-like DNA-binding protein